MKDIKNIKILNILYVLHKTASRSWAMFKYRKSKVVTCISLHYHLIATLRMIIIIMQPVAPVITGLMTETILEKGIIKYVSLVLYI